MFTQKTPKIVKYNHFKLSSRFDWFFLCYFQSLSSKMHNFDFGCRPFHFLPILSWTGNQSEPPEALPTHTLFKSRYLIHVLYPSNLHSFEEPVKHGTFYLRSLCMSHTTCLFSNLTLNNLILSLSLSLSLSLYLTFLFIPLLGALQ